MQERPVQSGGISIMTSKKESVEGRKHRRFKVPKDAFVALRSDYLKLGQIEHVGIDGLEFSYATSEGPLDAPFELDIFLAGTAFYLYKVPFQTVSDAETVNETPFPSLPIRQCAVQFGELTTNQRSQLEYFIQNYTTGEA
jgi:hypothetical protein